MRPLICLTLLAAALTSISCQSPTAPDPRRGVVELRISSCDGSGRSPLECRAETVCVGFYRCPDPLANGRDATDLATWTVSTPTVARVMAPGKFEAVGIGNTSILATLSGADGSRLDARRTVSVFPGTAPLPTTAFVGSVWEAGKTESTGPISGAVIEVLDGLIAGRTAVTGAVPQAVPGFTAEPARPHRYQIYGVPPGRYRVRVVAEGYVAQERAVSVAYASVIWEGAANGDFQLVPR